MPYIAALQQLLLLPTLIVTGKHLHMVVTGKHLHMIITGKHFHMIVTGKHLDMIVTVVFWCILLLFCCCIFAFQLSAS